MGVMVTVGRQYTDDCPNGAANYLVVSGAIILISNLVRLVLVCGHSCVVRLVGSSTCPTAVSAYSPLQQEDSHLYPSVYSSGALWWCLAPTQHGPTHPVKIRKRTTPTTVTTQHSRLLLSSLL